MSMFKRIIPKRWRDDAPTIPVVRLSGVIGVGSPIRPGLSLTAVAGSLEKAFAQKNAPAVAIAVNSPGGSPVQSHLIYKRIRELARLKEKHVVVFCEDVAASGGYMIAAAGDEIFADASSIVGSIGVISQGFGFVELIEKLGVERRVYTAGENKSVLDPFRPENPDDITHLKQLQQDVHADFIDLVKSRRGARLAEDPDIFTGLFWSGRRAEALGLVDALGDLKSVMTERYGDKVKLALIQPRRSILSRRPAFGIGRDTSLAGDLIDAVEERLLWARYGL